jgi:hypothetical protein
MPLQKFLNLLALMIGTAGVLLVSKAAYVTPRQMLQATFHYSPIDWPSTEIIANLVAPKADVSISVVTLAIAFAIQFVSIMFVKEETPFLGSKLHGLLLALAFAAVVSLILYLAHQGVHKQNVEQVKRLKTTDYLERGLMREMKRSVPNSTELKVEFSGLKHIIGSYFGIEREEGESPSDFVRRVAGLIGFALPEGLDFRKLDNLHEPQDVENGK